jgi:two-component system sensor histidine kinase AlgZ
MATPEQPGPHAQDFASDFGATGTRPASVWPESARPGGEPSSQFSPTRFDPLADERARLQSLAAAAFDVCHPALALRALLLVQLALLPVGLAGAGSWQAWWTEQAVLAFGSVMATGLWLVAVCALRRPLQRLPAPGRAATVMALGAAAAEAAWAPLAWAGFVQDAPLRAVAALVGGASLAALLWAWLELRARIWQPANASARLAELQSRIRPHFLFNALNTALALVRVEPAKAESVLEDLAELFRTALAETGVSVTLAEEIDLARRYLAIEEIRFGPRMQVAWEIDAQVNRTRVPPLVLQPLVENAVRHGIEPAQGGGHVRVRAQRQAGLVVVRVSNTLGDEPGSPGHGMALANVRERLRLLHDLAAQCDVWRDSSEGREWFHAQITLPVA